MAKNWAIFLVIQGFGRIGVETYTDFMKYLIPLLFCTSVHAATSQSLYSGEVTVSIDEGRDEITMELRKKSSPVPVDGESPNELLTLGHFEARKYCSDKGMHFESRAGYSDSSLTYVSMGFVCLKDLAESEKFIVPTYYCDTYKSSVIIQDICSKIK